MLAGSLAYSKVERLLHLVRGSAFFAYIQICVMVMVLWIYFIETPSHILGNSIMNNTVVLEKCQKPECWSLDANFVCFGGK